MKSAIYIDEGTTQVVLTPENEWERAALKMIANSSGQESQTFWATFYECNGGWLREGRATWPNDAWNPGGKISDDASLMFRIKKKLPAAETIGLELGNNV